MGGGRDRRDLSAACGLGGLGLGGLAGCCQRRRGLGDGGQGSDVFGFLFEGGDPIGQVGVVDGAVDGGAVGEEDGDGLVLGENDTTGHDRLRGSFQVAEILQAGSDVVGALEVVDGGVEVVSLGVVHDLEDVELTGSGVPRGAVRVHWVLGGSWDVCVQQPDGRHVVSVGLVLLVLLGHVGWGPELKEEHLVEAVEAVVGLTVGSVSTAVVLALALDVRGNGHLVAGGNGGVIEDLRVVRKLEAVWGHVVDGVAQTCVLISVVGQEGDVVGSALLGVVVRLPLPASGTGAKRVRVGDIVAELSQVERASQVDRELFVQGSQRAGENERVLHVLLARAVAVTQGLNLRHRVVIPEVPDVVELQDVGWRGRAGLGESGVQDAEGCHGKSECGEFAEHGCCVCASCVLRVCFVRPATVCLALFFLLIYVCNSSQQSTSEAAVVLKEEKENSKTQNASFRS